MKCQCGVGQQGKHCAAPGSSWVGEPDENARRVVRSRESQKRGIRVGPFAEHLALDIFFSTAGISFKVLKKQVAKIHPMYFPKS